jgi:hypothetical protein
MAVSREGLGFYNSPFVAEDVLRRNGIDLEADVRDGVLCFQRLLGRRPVGGCAPCYCWTDRVEALWRQAGIRYIQTRLFQDVGGAGWRSHYLGERSVAGGVYLLRNCSFEPAGEGSRALARCLRGVARAFRLGKPAIICSHRVNFVGAIDPANRETGLRLLGELLRTVRNRWPDVHFLSSAELGGTIEQDMEQACRARRRPPP